MSLMQQTKNELKQLRLKLHKYYTAWQNGLITKEEYLIFAAPLDAKIRKLETFTLFEHPVFEKQA